MWRTRARSGVVLPIPVPSRMTIAKMPDSTRKKPSTPPRTRDAPTISAERSLTSDRGLRWRERLLREVEAVGHAVGGLVVRVDRRQAEGLLAELHEAHMGVLRV